MHRPPQKRQRLFNVHAANYQDPGPNLGNSNHYGFIPSDDEEYYPEETATFERYLRNVDAQQQAEIPEENLEQAELNF